MLRAGLGRRDCIRDNSCFRITPISFSLFVFSCHKKTWMIPLMLRACLSAVLHFLLFFSFSFVDFLVFVCHNPTMQSASYLLVFSCIFGLVVVVAKLAHCGALAGLKQWNGRVDM